MRREHKTVRTPEARAHALGIPDILIDGAKLDKCLEALVASHVSGILEDRIIMRADSSDDEEQCPQCFATLESETDSPYAYCPYCGPQLAGSIRHLQEEWERKYRTATA